MTTNNGAGGLPELPMPMGNQIVMRGDDRQNDYVFHTPAYTADQMRAYAQAALQAPGEAVAHSVVAGEVRRNDDGSLDEVCGFGRYHLEQMHNCGWSLRLGRHLISLHATRVIKASIIENDLDDEPQSTTPPPSDVLRRVVEALPAVDAVVMESECSEIAARKFYVDGWNACLAAHKALAEGVGNV